MATERPASRLHPLSAGTLYEHYQILEGWELAESAYYDAVDLICTQSECGTRHGSVPGDGLCLRCRTPLETVLIHERGPIPGDPLSAEKIDLLLRLGQAGHPHVLT